PSGRAWVYALGGSGQKGVAHVLRLIEAEMRVAMALTGATSIDKIDRSILAETAR
ncbi:MAG: L-lactate dehydrogenase, partial [Burkholderiales bacterium]